MLKENEQLDDLQLNGLGIIQNKTKFKFGTDAVLLSDFAKVKSHGRCIDLGTGTGIIPLLISAKYKPDEIIGLEIQSDLCEMASRSVVHNGLEDLIKIVNGDIKNIRSLFKKESFENVITNPPYMKNGSGFKSEDESIALSRHEIKCSIDDIAAAAEYLLKDKGMISMVHRPNRLVDVVSVFRKHSLEPKSIRFVHPYAGKAPNLFLINALKNSQPFLKIEDPLIMRRDDGDYTDEIYKMYGLRRK